MCGRRVFSDDYWLCVRCTEGKQHEEGNQQGEQSIHGYLLFGWCGSTVFHAINAFNHKEATLSCGVVMLSGWSSQDGVLNILNGNFMTGDSQSLPAGAL